MARTLNKTQKNMLDNWFKNAWTGPGSIYCYEQIPVSILNQIVLSNDYETIYQDIDRYIGDKALEKIYG